MRTRKTVVVLVSGKAGSGKTTVADMLERKLGDIPSLSVFRYSFAGPLKFIAKSYIGWDGEKDEKGRKLLQDIGRVGRDYDKNIWVKHLLGQMDKQSGMLPFNFVIVDDWRFPNEYEYLRKNPLIDVYTVRISGKQAELIGETAIDVSEHSLPNIPDELYNTFIDNSLLNLGGLESVVDGIVETLTERYILE
jgi:hypothetical protein